MLLAPKRWFRRASEFTKAPDPERAQIHIEKLVFSDGTEVKLKHNTIFVLTGPNNAGKSSALREIRDFLRKARTPKPVLSEITTSISGTEADFRKLIETAGLKDRSGKYIQEGWDDYALSKVKEDFEQHFVGKYPMNFFLSYLGAGDRLALTKPVKRKNYRTHSPDHPVLWLELDESAHDRILTVFEKSFGQRLALNVLSGEEIELHVLPWSDHDDTPESAREYIRWINTFPRLEDQGDGMRSFTGAMLSLLVHPRNIVLIDEPEAFLHPPQAKRLAEIVAEEMSSNSQIFIATHNEEIIKSLLNAAGDQVVIARITRTGNENAITVIDHDQIIQLWNDPLLRTSDVLSSLFHSVAIFCEGESDARFFRAILDATRGNGRESDSQFYHVGGKDRIASVAKALRVVGVPVMAIVDIDILSDKGSFLRLFDSLGGDRREVEIDLKVISEAVEAKIKPTYSQLAEDLRKLATQAETEKDISKKTMERIADLTRSVSFWQRIKHVGQVGFDNANAFNAFGRIAEKGKDIGLLILSQGELEGFCRSVSRSKKSAWLSTVLDKELATDPTLEDARHFAATIRETIEWKSTSSA